MTDKMTLVENQELADEVIRPILRIIDEVFEKYDIDRLKETLKAMNNQTSHVKAFPFPETMDKADNMQASNDLFEIIMKLIELRKKQMEIIKKQSRESAGMNVLKQLGF